MRLSVPILPDTLSHWNDPDLRLDCLKEKGTLDGGTGSRRRHHWIARNDKLDDIPELQEHHLYMASRQQSYKICPGNDPVAIHRINKQHRQFWIAQNELRDKRMTDPVIFGIATNDMRSEAARFVSVKVQKTLEMALADAENAKRLFQSDYSRKGGLRRRSDALQKSVVEIVRKNPETAQNELFQELRRQEGDGVIFSIDGDSSVLVGDGRQIHFYDHEGNLKEAAVNGLKDRLYRAKRYIRANR